MTQDCKPRPRKIRRMSEKRKRGRPRLTDRKPSEGRPELKLRLPPDVVAYLNERCGYGGRQAYVLGLIRADMESKANLEA